jgi:valyl-tRNA synthetase
MDLAQERLRLAKEVSRLDGEIEKIAKKLGNEQFVAKAKPEVVQEQRERQLEYEAARRKMLAAQDRLTGL